jgi:hypothetical protein
MTLALDLVFDDDRPDSSPITRAFDGNDDLFEGSDDEAFDRADGLELALASF